MRSYRIEEHVADVRARVTADNLPELFRAALEVMNEISGAEKADDAPPEAESISVTATDSTALLIDFLSELLTRGHIQNTIFEQVRFETLTDRTLEASLEGFEIERLKKDIKAVTYHEADVRKNAEGQFETLIVFDI